MPRCNLERCVNVVNGERDAVHTNFIRVGGLRLDRIGVKILEELELAVTIRRLENGDLGVVAIEADGGVGPVSADCVAADDFQTQVNEEGD